MRPRTRQYLRCRDWPAADRTLWKAAFAPGTDIFDDTGSGARLAERTIQQLEYTYGKFLFFVVAEHPELLDRPPVDRVNPAIVAEFANSQPTSCGFITRSVYVSHLGLAMAHLYPEANWSWIFTIAARLKARGRGRPEQHHLVTSETLYRLGIELMDGALSTGSPLSSWRVQTAFRDGLAIALAAVIAPRRRTLAALRIGKQLKKIGDLWVLDFPAEDIKTKRSLEYPIAQELSRQIDVYVNKIRPLTAGAGTHDYLWASVRGRPMHGSNIYNAVRKRTQKALGFPVNLHRFRRAAATFWSVEDPENVRGVKDLLGHADFATTEKYYIMAQSRLAGRSLARTIEALKMRHKNHRGPRTMPRQLLT